MSEWEFPTVDQVGSTEYPVRKFSFLWIIRNYEYTKGISFYSPKFTHPITGVTWESELHRDESVPGNSCFVVQVSSSSEMMHDNPLLGIAEILNSGGETGALKELKVSGTLRWEARFALTAAYDSMLVDKAHLRILVRLGWNAPPLKSVVHSQALTEAQTETQSTEITTKQSSENDFKDFTVTANGTSYRVHKYILTSRSPVFERMLISEMTESRKSCVKLEGFRNPVVEGMLEYIYTNKTTISAESALEYLHIADQYQIEGLKVLAEHTLMNNLNRSNCFEVYDASVLYKSPNLTRVAVRLIKMSTEKINKSTAWKESEKMRVI